MLVLLKKADGDEQPEQVNIQHYPFWVRIKNLPFNYRSNIIVKNLIGNMGEILEIEKDVLGFGKYRRVKVLLDITKPLRRNRRLKDKNGREFQVDFAYERLPFFCFACGVMVHAEKDCQNVVEEQKLERLGWSLSLKATPRKGRAKELVEENKYRACKKIIFTSEGHKSEAGQLNLFGCESTKTDPTVACSPDLENFPSINPAVSCSRGTTVGDPKVQFLGNVTDVACKPPVVDEYALNASLMPHVVENNNDDSSFIVLLQDPTSQHDKFVFSSSKGKAASKSPTWKRIARGPMEDKG